MKRKIITVMFSVLIMISVCFVHIGVYAEVTDTHNDTEITPYYTAIVICYNNLKLNSGGKLTCEGETGVQNEYTAGVKMELQQLSEDWTTIKTWEDNSNDEAMYLCKNWYVERGSYRLKLTHTAMDSFGDVIETVTKYSKIVVY